MTRLLAALSEFCNLCGVVKVPEQRRAFFGNTYCWDCFPKAVAVFEADVKVLQLEQNFPPGIALQVARQEWLEKRRKAAAGDLADECSTVTSQDAS